MPTYGYECARCKEQFEVVQKITDDPLKVHEGCGGDLRRLMYPVGIVFKGSGFYVNDYAKAKNGAASVPANGNGSNGTSAEAKSTESKPEAKPESKPEAASKP